jgi:predicted transcriptional regulator
MGNQTITVRTGSDTVEKISNIAEAMDRSRNWVNEDALKQYIAQQAWYIEGIQEARASLAEGKGIPHDEVMAGLAELIDGKIKDHEKTQ